MREFIQRAIAFQPDKLIIEGTNITNRAVQYDGPKSEDDVLQKMKDIMRDAVGDVYVCTSSTHVDRVAVICEAAKAAGLTVVMSASTGAILRSAASYFSGLPHLDQEKVRVYYNEDEHNRATVTNRGKKQTLISRIFNKGYAVTSNSLPGERIVFVGNARAIEFFPRFRDNSTAIFSLYSGYLEDGSFGESFRRTMEERGVPVELCHTSGHARREDLINAILAIRPKVVFPVHTEHPEDFEDERLRTAGIRLLNYGAKVTN
jgi:ribonuclease J